MSLTTLEAGEGKLQESGNETKTIDAKANKMKPKAQRDRAHAAVRYVSPYFHNDGQKNIKPHRLETHVDSVALTPNSGDFFENELQESGKEIESITFKSKKRRESKNQKAAEDQAEVRKVSPYFQNDNEKKTFSVEAVADDESDFHSVPSMGTCGDIVQDMVKENGDKIAINKIRSKGKRTPKKHEHVERDQIQKVSSFFQSGNEKLDFESHCYGCETGSVALPHTSDSFLEDNLPENGKTKSKKKKKKAIADKLQENGNNSGVKPKKKTLKVQKIVAHDAVRYVSPYFQKDSAKKINVKPLDVESNSTIALRTFANVMEDKLQENDCEMKIKQQELEIQDNSVALTANSGDFFEDELLESGNEVEAVAIKSRKKRKTVNQKAAEEHAVVRKVSPYFQNQNEKKTVSVEALDHESEFNSVATVATFRNIVQDKGEENGHKVAKRIKRKGRKISKKHEPLEHAQIPKVSPFFQGGNERKADAESCCYGNEIGSITLSGSVGSILEDRPQENGNEIENGKIKSKENRAIADKLQENGNDTETSSINYKKTIPVVQKNIANGAVRCVSPYFNNDSEKKINVKTLNMERKSQVILALPTCGDIMEDKLQKSRRRKKNKQQGLESHLDSVVLTAASGDLFEDELQEDGKDVETIKIISNKRKTRSPKTLENVEVRKVSPYFQTPCLTGCEQVEKAKKERTCVNSSSSSLKISPYFQKGPKVEDNCSKKSKRTKRNLLPYEKMDEAYKRRTPDNTWKPPRSEFCLIQEDHAHDPWRVLVICMLLNLTTGSQVYPCIVASGGFDSLHFLFPNLAPILGQCFTVCLGIYFTIVSFYLKAYCL